MVDIEKKVTIKNLIRANQRMLKEGGPRPQWVELPEDEDLVDKTNKESKEFIKAMKSYSI